MFKKNLTFPPQHVKLYTRKQVSLGNNFCIGLSFELTVQLGREIIQPAFFFLPEKGRASEIAQHEFGRDILNKKFAAVKTESFDRIIESEKVPHDLFLPHHFFDSALSRGQGQ